jgi:tetratricopeptide (TPR) repeat protein
MKRRIIFLLLIGCVSLAVAQAASLFEQANTAYTKGRYSQATDLYQQVIGQTGLSAELLGNLADSYAADGQPGLAVLHYERALLVSPGNAALRTALTALRQKEGLLQEQRLHERLAGLLGADQWLLLSGAAFVLLSLTVLAAGLLGRRRFPYACRISAFFLTATLLPLPPAWLRYQAWQDGVVTTESAKMLLSPFADAEIIGNLKAGSIIRPCNKEHGSYALIRDNDGHSGWLDRSSFQRVVAGQL